MSGPVEVSSLKIRLRITDGDDDPFIVTVVDAVNEWLVGRVGMDVVPAAGTAVRTLDGSGSRELFVPGGLRGLGTVEVSLDGSSWVDVTADVELLPRDWERPPNEPYHTLRIRERPAGSASAFPSAESSVRVTTAQWGYERWPADLVEVGETVAARMYAARVTGQRDVIGSDATGAPLVSRFVSSKDRETIDSHRFANSDFGYV